jgi:hypothetical protein
MAKHLPESHAAKHLPHHSAPAGSDSRQQQQHQQQHPSGSPLDGILGASSKSSSSSATEEVPQDRQDGAAVSLPAVAVGDKEPQEIVQQVVRESRAEADAALRYAHEV